MNFEYDFAISFAGDRPNKNHDVLEEFLEYFLRRCKDHNIRINP